MFEHVRPVLVIFGALTVVTGLVYPSVVTVLAHGFFRHEANGSLIRDQDGKPVGSELIAQPFDAPHYFRSRPSATAPFPNNSASSTGSNQGPTNPALLKDIADRVEAMRKAHPDQTGPVPADLVTASASGLDPHISPAAAEYQMKRVAAARGTTVDEIRQIVVKHTRERTVGLLGERRVNVLTLNRELDVSFPVSVAAAAPAVPAVKDNLAPLLQAARLLVESGDETGIEKLQELADANLGSAEARLALAEAYRRFGQLRPAAKTFRDAAMLFPVGSQDAAEAEQAARDTLRWAGLERFLPHVIAGAVNPTTAGAWADFGQVCRYKGRFALATRFFRKAAEMDDKFLREATTCAVLAGFNRGTDASDLTAEERADLRQAGLAGLRRFPEWLGDPAIAALKNDAVMAELGAVEREAWQSLWRNQEARR
jgi:K+-transporting ATPase ATPase C chain